MEGDVYEDNSLVLAAEDFEINQFENFHFFTSQDKRCISKLRAHGPVLLKGARGCGKSALMIKASLGLYPKAPKSTAIGIYISLRHLDLLRASGPEYIELFCKLVVREVNKQLERDEIVNPIHTITDLQSELTLIAEKNEKRMVLMFDDAAHIGREANLNEFFDIFRTLSNNSISCKASIYPGVTKFGTRFDVYNDATVIDVNRSENSEDFARLFEEVVTLRFRDSLDDAKFEGGINKQDASKLLGLAVLGNMRAFIYTCNQLITSLENSSAVSYTHISEVFKQLSQNYFWPLLEEIEPKLGMYQPMVSPAFEISQILFEKAGEKCERSVLVLREIVQRLSKPVEILEYVGFIARKEVSRVMKSRGRGTRFVLNLCNITEYLEHGRLNSAIVSKWLSLAENSVEFHKGSEFYKLPLPDPLEDHDLSILKKEIGFLKKSNVYPYGLTESKIQILLDNGIETIEDLAMKTDDEILALPQVGVETLKRFRSTVNQAIWM